jgi:hypothetical protein
MNQAIKEHQDKCRNAVYFPQTREDIIYQLKSDINHINLNQYAGKTREIMEKLTKLVAL